MPTLLVRAVTQRQTDYRTFKKSLVDALDHPVSSNWPSSSRLHQMKRRIARVNNRMRRKKLFEPKKEEESEK